MSTEVALGKNQDPSRSVRFKLVKSSGYHSKSAPFSDSIHNFLEARGLAHSDAIYVTE